MPSVASLEAQPQLAPINDAGIQALKQLAQQTLHQRRLQERLQKAADLITNVTGALNDRGFEERSKHDRRRARLQANDEEEDEEQREQYEAFQNKVDTLTKTMDKSIRSVIDDRTWLEALPDALRRVGVETGALSQPTQRSTLLPTQDVSQRDSDHREEDDMDADSNSTPERPPDPAEAPTALLHAALSTQSTQWTSKTLTERYAYDNDYTGFYRIIHDAKHPGDDAPDLPAASIWFAGEEGRDTARLQTQLESGGGDDEDSDLEVAAERVRIKCPITLLYFQDPVTSSKCRHSYEKHAILDLLKDSGSYVPWTTEQQAELNRLPARERPRRERQMRVPQVRCPECNVVLTEADLRPNPVLLRKVRRVVEAEKREHEAATSDLDEDDEEIPKGTQRKPYGLESSPMTASRVKKDLKAQRIKADRAPSMIPQTQMPDGTQSTRAEGAILELDDDDEMDE